MSRRVLHVPHHFGMLWECSRVDGVSRTLSNEHTSPTIQRREPSLGPFTRERVKDDDFIIEVGSVFVVAGTVLVMFLARLTRSRW